MIALGCDHGGYDLMQSVKAFLDEKGVEYKDFGTYSKDSCDYPFFGQAAAKAVQSGECDRGIVICSTGIGISIAANRFKGIRCGLCHDVMTARLTREHNNANMLAMGAKCVDEELAREIVKTFLETEFSNGERHIRRIELIDKYSDDIV